MTKRSLQLAAALTGGGESPGRGQRGTWLEQKWVVVCTEDLGALVGSGFPSQFHRSRRKIVGGE